MANPEGYTLNNGSVEVVISPFGTNIESFRIGEHLILGTFDRIDGKKGAMTHPCTPIFGINDAGKALGLEQHGPLRGDRVVPILHSNAIFQSDFVYTIQTGTFPDGLIAKRSFRLLRSGLSIATTHINVSDHDIPVMYGEHCYYNCPEGNQNVKFNGLLIANLAAADTVIKLNRRSILDIPGSPRLALLQQGLDYVNFWVATKNDQVDTHYIGVEPAEGDPFSDFFGSRDSLLGPGEQRYASVTIKLAD